MSTWRVEVFRFQGRRRTSFAVSSDTLSSRVYVQLRLWLAFPSFLSSVPSTFLDAPDSPSIRLSSKRERKVSGFSSFFLFLSLSASRSLVSLLPCLYPCLSFSPACTSSSRLPRFFFADFHELYDLERDTGDERVSQREKNLRKEVTR